MRRQPVCRGSSVDAAAGRLTDHELWFILCCEMRKDAERNRDRIATVARELIAIQGADVSMEAIAAGADVAVGTL